MAAHDQQGCHRVSYQVRRNASEGNVKMATAALRREDNEVYRLVDDGAREAAADVAVAQHEASGGDSSLLHAGADLIKVIVCNVLIAQHELPPQLQIFSLWRPDFGKLWHRNHMGEEEFCAFSLRKTQCERKRALGSGRSVQWNKDSPIMNDPRLRSRCRYEQDRARGTIDDFAGRASEVPFG
jgi:hypothetical protein